MQKVRLTEIGFTGIKRTEDDIYNMYSTEEVLNMDNISKNEKDAIKMAVKWGSILGWIESVKSEEQYKIFVQIYKNDILEYVD